MGTKWQPDAVLPGDRTVPVPKGRINWRDTFSVWPALTIAFHPLPWTWRLDYYKDELEPWWAINCGPFDLSFG